MTFKMVYTIKRNKYSAIVPCYECGSEVETAFFEGLNDGELDADLCVFCACMPQTKKLSKAQLCAGLNTLLEKLGVSIGASVQADAKCKNCNK